MAAGFLIYLQEERSRNFPTFKLLWFLKKKTSMTFNLALNTFILEFFMCVDFITFAQAGYGLKDTLTEGSNRVLNAGSKA